MKVTSVLARGAVVCFVGVGVAAAGCAGPSASGGCHYETWQGQCTLTAVRTTRTVERFPKSYVEVEALYEPKGTEGVFAPPPFRKTFLAPAENEFDLTEHLHKYPVVACAVQNPIGDPCAPTMAANVPEFIPPATSVATGPVGCAKIEHQGSAADVPASVTMPGPFQFDEGSAMDSADIKKLADDAAAVLKSNSRIECVAIKGTSAPGENFALANARAQTVRQLLEERGVDHSRVTVFESSAPAYTAAPDDQPVLSEQRRVRLSVVVYGAAP
jgi:outer membrane protein OmpA-like peptidoglycan-associated protein